MHIIIIIIIIIMTITTITTTLELRIFRRGITINYF